MFKIIVIGAGPAGLSAAARAAESDVSHVLLESTQNIANTIQKYQKGKLVMAEPDILPLRACIEFTAGRREDILEAWQKAAMSSQVNVQYGSEVNAIVGEKGRFEVTLTDGRTLLGENIILGLGIQGNPRRLGVPGQDSHIVQYQLDDPELYRDETIVVVGGGDAAIENALALSARNKVYIVNRRDEFARAKKGNLDLILSKIESGELECFYNTTPIAVEQREDDQTGGLVKLSTPAGEAEIQADRIIARLGSLPPRSLVESFGIKFPNDDPNATPVLTPQYQSNVPGIYVIGALAGYPLIKQAINQGYEVVEHIEGRDVRPADHDLIASKIGRVIPEMNLDDILREMQERIPVFSGVNALQFRELMLESNVHSFRKGELIFAKNDYTNSFYTIFSGNVEIEINDHQTISSGVGNFFGEMSLLSGRRRSASVYAGDDCIVIETPRRTINKLRTSIEAVQAVLDRTSVVRTIQQKFAPNMPFEELELLADKARINRYEPNQVIFAQGEEGDSLHFIRSGSATVAVDVEGREVVVSYVPANQSVGEMALLGDTVRSATVRAAAKTETLSFDRDSFNKLFDSVDGLRESMQDIADERIRQNLSNQQSREDGEDILGFLISQGLGEATDVLLIDENLCVACDFCEQACAATHSGTSRLNRKAGPTYASIHIPTSCRHCEDPSCMKECPPDAIHRGGVGGEVYISDSCIGCGNCEKNCPYGVIQMSYEAEASDNFWQWLLFGRGEKPGYAKSISSGCVTSKKAVKCDMCKDQSGGPACVRACPTGAAARVSPEDFVNLIS